MKSCAVAILLLSALTCWAGAKPNPAEYTIGVHVGASHMVLEGNSVTHHQHLNVVIDGKKYELESIGAPNALLVPGDYKAKLVKDEHARTYDSWQTYEFLFPDGKTREFLVVGREE